MTDLDKLEELCSRATPGPWRVSWNAEMTAPEKSVLYKNTSFANIPHGDFDILSESDKNDWLFICEARTALPLLIKRVRYLEKALRYYADRMDDGGTARRALEGARLDKKDE